MIELVGISKDYNGVNILRDVNFCAEKGDLIAITGKSGSGKSTLLNLLSGIESPSKGDVVIMNTKNPKPNSAVMQRLIRDHINYMFQNFALIESDTVINNLRLALTYAKTSKTRKKDTISKALGSVEMEGTENRKIYTLSGGEQQRVAMARILVNPKDILLADEPTGSLDDENKLMVTNFLKQASQKGMTVVVVTHDISVAEACQRHYVLENGCLHCLKP